MICHDVNFITDNTPGEIEELEEPPPNENVRGCLTGLIGKYYI
jgi:hypothetical protein